MTTTLEPDFRELLARTLDPDLDPDDDDDDDDDDDESPDNVDPEVQD
jgi:hypothetical protein